MENQRAGALLRFQQKALGQLNANALRLQEFKQFHLVGQFRAGRVAEAEPATLVRTGTQQRGP